MFVKFFQMPKKKNFGKLWKFHSPPPSIFLETKNSPFFLTMGSGVLREVDWYYSFFFTEKKKKNVHINHSYTESLLDEKRTGYKKFTIAFEVPKVTIFMPGNK